MTKKNVHKHDHIVRAGYSKVEKRHRLKYLFKEMSEAEATEEQLREWSAALKQIYADNFRHYYSDFFSQLNTIFKQQGDGAIGIVSANAFKLQQYISSTEKGESADQKFLASIDKLVDHLNLECSRIQYYSQYTSQLNDLKENISLINDQTEKANETYDQLKSKMDSAHADSVAVLGIFVAIMVAFSGGFSYISSCVASISSAPISKLLLFVTLCGFILFNIIFLLMYLVSKILGKSIYARCRSVDCTCGPLGMPACSFDDQIRKRLPYVYWANKCFCYVILIDVCYIILEMIWQTYWHLLC